MPRKPGRPATKRKQGHLVGSTAAIKESRAKKQALPAESDEEHDPEEEGKDKPAKEGDSDRKAVPEKPGLFEKQTRKFLAGMGPSVVSSSAVDEFVRIGLRYRDQVLGDLEAYAQHAGRRKIEEADVRLLFRRQKLNRNQNLNHLIRTQLPGTSLFRFGSANCQS